MKRIISLILCTCLIFGMCVTLVSAEDTVLLECDLQEIVPAKYDDAYSFSDGYAAVEIDGLWGYIDTEGNIVIEPQYLSAGYFSDGHAVVSKMGVTREFDLDLNDFVTFEAELLYFIDTEGNETPIIGYDSMLASWGFDPEFTEAPLRGTAFGLRIYDEVLVYNYMAFGIDGRPIYPDTSTAKDQMLRDDYNYFDVTGPSVNGLIPVRAEYVPTTMAYACFLMDKTGKIVREYPHPEMIEESGIITVYAYNDGLSIVVYQVSDFVDWSVPYTTDYFIGVLDNNNNWVVEPEITNYWYFYNGNYFSDGLFVTSFDGGENWGAVNTEGKAAIPYEYDYLTTFSYGFAPARIDGEWFYIDTENNRYEIPSFSDKEVKIEGATEFNENGIAAVYDAISDSVYFVRKPTEPMGELTAIINDADEFSIGTFFDNYDASINAYTKTYDVKEYYFTVNDSGKYGISKLIINEIDPDAPKLNGEPSAWAKSEILKALEADLVPDHINGNYTDLITREEFCDLIIRMIEMKAGKPVADVIAEYAEAREEVTFTDTDNENVVAAYRLGIVNGRSTTEFIFDPTASITRQEAAKMLACAAKVLGADIKVDPVEFADGDTIHGWAAEFVYFVNRIGVMNGTSTATPPTFSPLGTYTREQSILTVYRLFNAL